MIPNISEELHPLIEIFRNTLEELKGLSEYLERESLALSERSADEIKALAQKKHESVNRIHQQSVRENHFFESKSLPPGETGLDRLLERVDDSDPEIQEVRSLRTQIREYLEHCQTLNARNGASIDLISRHTRRAIELLKNPVDQPTSYGPDGNPQQTTISRARVSV